MPFGGWLYGPRVLERCAFFFSTTGEKWTISDSIMVLQSIGGEPVPLEHTAALQAELVARAGKQLGGRGLKQAANEPLEVTATLAPPPTKKAPKFAATACGFASAFVIDVAGIQPVARHGACEAFGELQVPSTHNIVSGVACGLGKSKLSISEEVT